MKQNFFSLLRFVIGWPLTLAALFFMVKFISPKAGLILPHLSELNFSLLTAGSLSFLGFYFMRGYIWQVLLRSLNYEIPFRHTLFSWAASELKRYVPGNIWSFMGRAVSFSEKGVKKKDTASLLIVEAELLVLGSLTFSILALPFLNKYGLFVSSEMLRKLLVDLVLLVDILYIFNKSLLNILPAKLSSSLKFALPSHAKPFEVFKLLCLSGISFFFFGLGYFLTVSSFSSIHPQLIVELSGFFVLSFLIGYLSFLTPSGFGIREGILIMGISKLTPLSVAVFLALYSRVVLVAAELIFVVLSYLYSKISGGMLKTEKWIFEHKHETVLALLFIAFSVYFSITSFLRYDNFYTGKFDLGNMAQTVWNTMNGRIFEFTNPNGTENLSRLAFHADFLLILLAPFYTLWPNPKMLLLIQTLVLGAGSFFVFLIARHLLKNKNLALVLAFSFLLNPAVQRTDLYDFHAVTLATTFLLGTYYFYLKKKLVLFFLFAVLSGFCKEQIWLIVGLFGLLLFFNKKRVLGASFLIICSGIFYYLVSAAIPAAMGGDHFALSYFSDFGDNPLQIIGTMLFSPDKILSIIFQEPQQAYIKQLLMPLGYLSLLFPFTLVFAIPDALINLLSSNTQLHQIYYQYSATISPFLFISAIYAIKYVRKFLPELPDWTIITYFLFAALYGAFMYGPLPGAREPNIDMFIKPLKNKEFIENFISRIPQSYSVAASNNLGSHMSQRQTIYILPLGLEKADYVLFLLNDSEMAASLNAERKQVEELRQDPEYILVADQGDFLAFRKRILN